MGLLVVMTVVCEFEMTIVCNTYEVSGVSNRQQQ